MPKNNPAQHGTSPTNQGRRVQNNVLYADILPVKKGNPAACIFVASLNKNVQDSELNKSVFEEFKQWGRLLNNVEDSKRALEESQGMILNGRSIRCEPARIGNDNRSNRQQYLSLRLSVFGEIENIFVPQQDPSKFHMAFVRYRYRDDAIHAFIALKGPEFYHPWLVHWTSNVDMNNMSNMINEQRFIDKCCLFVGNLSESTSEEELNELFGQYGIIIYIRVIRKYRENEKKVFAFIKYQSESEANTAIQHQSIIIMMHTTANCPLRSMAWITMNENNRVIEATKEMIELLEYDPINQPFDTLWTYQHHSIHDTIVNTEQKTINICLLHPKIEGKRTGVCLDVTDLNHIFTPSDLTVLRLSIYGTIEAISPGGIGICKSWVGQPVMRYIHSDDLKKFCASTSRATRYSSIVQLSARLESGDSFDWTVMPVENKLIYLIRPSSKENDPKEIPVVHQLVTEAQRKFSEALENGVTWLTHHLAYGLLIFVQTLWGLSTYRTELNYLIKKRSEIDLVCQLMGYFGISEHKSRSWIDQCVDQTLEWFIKDNNMNALIV
ncbi:hypothetical protein G6F37_001732 [Rhizopus arrhizus]|nr:hypothetical protein G6F38_008470 [Rhizopus arrhizus]KAG1162894.1 hypothetical protein G6F37_001732 [Rhizopus arrhizus]